MHAIVYSFQYTLLHNYQYIACMIEHNKATDRALYSQPFAIPFSKYTPIRQYVYTLDHVVYITEFRFYLSVNLNRGCLHADLLALAPPLECKFDHDGILYSIQGQSDV